MDLGPGSDPETTYCHVVERLNRFGLAYLHIIEGATQGPREVPGGFDLQLLRRLFKGPYIANNGYDLELVLEARRRNLADLVAFGRLYIANPDLVERLRIGARLNVPRSRNLLRRRHEGIDRLSHLDGGGALPPNGHESRRALSSALSCRGFYLLIGGRWLTGVGCDAFERHYLPRAGGEIP